MSKKTIEEDAEWLKWQDKVSEIYDEIYYQTNALVTYINKAGHRWVEGQFKASDRFDKVLEVGAGTGEHLACVKHAYNEYFLTDFSESQLKVASERHAGNPHVIIKKEDATALSFPDKTFDRLISIYNLEHLPEPHAVLKEWRRVLKPGGTLSISIPTEGGVAWNLGRFLTTRRYFKRKGLNLDYIIAREHINACYRLVSLIQYYFEARKEIWFPLRVPTAHLNLIYSCNITL